MRANASGSEVAHAHMSMSIEAIGASYGSCVVASTPAAVQQMRMSNVARSGPSSCAELDTPSCASDATSLILSCSTIDVTIKTNDVSVTATCHVIEPIMRGINHVANV